MTRCSRVITCTVLAIPALVFLAGCSSNGGQSKGDASAGAGRKGDRIVPVAASNVERRELARDISVSGTIQPVRVTAVSSMMAGTIRTITVEEGVFVGRGRTIATLDAREVNAQLERARATLGNAKAKYERTKQLVERKLATAAELDQSLADFTIATSDVRLWETRRGFTRIAAPSSGVVTSRLVEVGGTVAANQKIVEIADVSTLVVRVRVSELDVVYMKVGDVVPITVDAYPGEKIEGRIRRIFPAADDSRLVPVEVAVGRRPPGVALKPGFLARLTFAIDRRSSVLAVPSGAIAVGESGAYVYVIRGDSLDRRTVKTGEPSEGWIEVVEGLDEGDRVVVGGQTTLRPGTRVRVVLAAADSATTGGRLE